MALIVKRWAKAAKLDPALFAGHSLRAGFATMTRASLQIPMVERYRLLDYEAAKEGMERDARENQVAQGTRDTSNRGKYLQLKFTVEDEGAFTMPWSATITYGLPLVEWAEHVCAENTQWFPGTEAAIPRADKPDF
jgi:hypothetical protein